MEGFAVLRACELAGVPALEAARDLNEIGEPDRALLALRGRRSRSSPPRCRRSSRRSMRELPGALPPGQRTVGQLIAESIRAYGAQFLKLLPLGLPFAVATQVALGRSVNLQTAALLVLSPRDRARVRDRVPARPRRPDHRDGLRRRPRRLPARADPRAGVRPPGARMARAPRPRRAGRDARGARLPRRARPRTPARHRGLPARVRVALRPRGRGRALGADADRAPADAGRQRRPGRARARRPRAHAAPLRRRRAPLSRPGGADRLTPTRPKETPRCPPTSSSRR